MLHQTSFQIINIYCIALSPFFDSWFLVTPFGIFASQAQKALCVLYWKLRNTNIFSDLELKLFDAFVTPILMYASVIWCYEKGADIEKINL